MRWFKHMTAAADDEKLAVIRDRFGLSGYGLYWLILEAIARQSSGLTCAVEYSFSEWRRKTGATPKMLREFLTFCGDGANFCGCGISQKSGENAEKTSESKKNSGVFSVTFSRKHGGEFARVECANLLKIRDEHSSRSVRQLRSDTGVTPELLRCKEVETETEPPTPVQGDGFGWADGEGKNAIRSFELGFSDFPAAVIGAWREERRAAGLSDHVDGNARAGALQLAEEIAEGRLDVERIRRAMRVLFHDQERKTWGLLALARNFGRFDLTPVTSGAGQRAGIDWGS